MSAKWRALQHRHRYTYNAVIFPHSYTHSLTHFPFTDDLFLKFCNELKQLSLLNSIYAQVNYVKNVSTSFSHLLCGCDDVEVVSVAARLYMEVLFLEGSNPLHRTLLTVLGKNKKFWVVIGGCFKGLCEDYGGKGKRFCVSKVALSMMGMPKLGYLVDVVEECCVVVAADVVNGLVFVVKETNGRARPSPLVMEQCQEGLSCLYYLLQRFPSKFVDVGGSLSEMVVTVILGVLKSDAFSRDCFVAAGVSFCAALQVLLNPQELGCFILDGVFGHKVCNVIGDSDSDYKIVASKVSYKGDIISELRSFSPLSRLCFVRGILTAVSRTVLNFQYTVESESLDPACANENEGVCSLSILYDCILPDLCTYCENPTDSHFNFHALTVLQICLQQVKTSILADFFDQTNDFHPLPEKLGSRLLRIIWNNLEDPLSQTVKQVHVIFDLLLDIKATVLRGEGSLESNSFMRNIAADLLSLGPRCKGRYVPLASLVKRLGAKVLLDMAPILLSEVAHSYVDDDVCCAATSFLKCFLERLRDEFWGSHGVERGYETYRVHCLPPFLHGLASGVSKLRSNLNTYALPGLLEIDVDSIFPMLSFLSVDVGVESRLVYPGLNCLDKELGIEQKVAVLVSLLKVSRSLALFEGDIESTHVAATPSDGGTTSEKFANVYIKGIQVTVPAEWLALALTHVDESLRVDAAESLFLNPKTASLPSSLELSLMRSSVPLNMRCCSTAFQMKWASLFRKFFSRVRTALERQIKQGIWRPSVGSKNDGVYLCKKGNESIFNQAEELYQFMKWLGRFLFFSCYPSAPYERKIMAMELIMIMVSIWSIVPPSLGDLKSALAEDLYPFSEGLTRPDFTMLLVGSIIDSWDRLRESSFRILLSYPTPLPGLSSEHMVRELILWAKKLVCSPRVRESDAGALALRLIFRKYVLELGWMVRASLNVVCHKSELAVPNGDHQISKSRFPVVQYISSLLDWLEAVVVEGEKDLLEACKDSFVHGVLLTLRYTFEELDWNSDVVKCSFSEMRCALGKMLELVMRITSLALWVVSADALHLPQDRDDIDEDSFLLEVSDETGMPASVLEHEAEDVKVNQDARPTAQIVMVGCWLAMKEVSLLLGTIIRKIPLPSEASSLDEDLDGAAILDMNQLEIMGNHFLEVLLKMKHNGAIDKTRAGFTALCNRLLCSNDPRLCHLTESWMEQLMERTVAKEQTVDDLLRRSAGLPAAFSAFFLSEPQGAPKKLLPRALSWLIEVAGGSMLAPFEPNNKIDKTTAVWNDEKASSETSADSRSSKIRVEGVIPTVHAFNVLKAAFNDSSLATDTSGFSAEAMMISIRSFSSPHWEIRNSACLAYTALVRRMIGFLNVHKRDSARRAITSLEFFHRYPLLHVFVFNELKVATELLIERNPKSNLASIVHPSLCPVLILLSRLKPSPIASEAGDQLDPSLFMPFIQRCSTQSNMRIRKLASRALTGLVSNEKLHSVLLDIASTLPNSRKQTVRAEDRRSLSAARACVSFNSIHGVLLQLGALLDANCRNLAEFPSKDLILGDLIKILIKCTWIGSPRHCPCPTLNASFLRVLDHMLSIAGTRRASTNYDVICSLLSELCSECLAVEPLDKSSFDDPTAVELRKQAAISYFHCVFLHEEHVEDVLLLPYNHSSADVSKQKSMVNNGYSVVERLICYMSDGSYEVRLATFKWLLQFVKTAETGIDDYQIAAIAHWAMSNLQATLISLLSKETHHKCTYYILRIIYAWNLSQLQRASDKLCGDIVYIGVLDLDSVTLFWDKLVTIHKTAMHSKTTEILLCCFGLCIRCFSSSLRRILADSSNLELPEFRKSDDFSRCTLLYERTKDFVCLIKQYSDPSQQVNLRMAAGKSVVVSGLLEQAESFSSLVINGSIHSEDSQLNFEPKNSATAVAFLILELWFTCIKLLEDEDVSIRKELALDAQKCFPETFRSTAGVVPVQVEKVIEQSFEFLSSIFGHWDVYVDYILRWMLDAAGYIVPEGDLVKRVFDKELDNYHEEKLLICQICCSHLEKLQVSKTQEGDFYHFLRTWRARFLHQLTSFANNHVENLGGADWVGGVGNHKDTFLPLYGNLLGFYVLSKCILHGAIEDGSSILSNCIELEKSIRPFMRNPLVCNLYILVVRLHEEKVGTVANHLTPQLLNGLQYWDDFDPYFLLG